MRTTDHAADKPRHGPNAGHGSDERFALRRGAPVREGAHGPARRQPRRTGRSWAALAAAGLIAVLSACSGGAASNQADTPSSAEHSRPVGGTGAAEASRPEAPASQAGTSATTSPESSRPAEPTAPADSAERSAAEERSRPADSRTDNSQPARDASGRLLAEEHSRPADSTQSGKTDS
ncbi:hypothetical protein CDO73_21580, partial [Saccharibacillus sp. O23]